MRFAFQPNDLGQRRWRRVGLAIAIVAVTSLLLAGAAWYWTAQASGFKAVNFSKIRPQLSRSEVVDLLGGPPGDYGNYADGFVESGDGSVLQVFFVQGVGEARGECWQDDRNRFFVFFDSGGKTVAASKANHFRRSPREGVLDVMKRLVRSLYL